MLQTTESSKNSPSLKDLAERDEVGIICSGDNCKDKTVERLPSKNLNRAIDYLTSKAWLAFTKLRKAFTKALILRHFDLEYHIQIGIDASGYGIDGVLSQLILDHLSQ